MKQQQPPRILLIDDNKHGLIARRNVLEDLGYAVETAESGRSGIEKFDREPFDLVVTDYRMPEVSGLEVLQKVRERNKRVPVVILSGYAEKLGLTQKSTGADAVLAKGPTEAQDLVRAVARLLKRRPRSALAGNRPHRASGGIS